MATALNFSDLVEEHGDYLLRYALRHFPQRDQAEELVQDTFVAALEAAGRFEGRSTPRTWLTSILRFKIIDRIRLKSRNAQISIDEIAQDNLQSFFNKGGEWSKQAEPLSWRQSPDALIQQRDFLTTLRNCLDKLPQLIKHAFLLREIDELQTEEICNSLGITATNLRVMLFRGRLYLRQCLDLNWLGKAVEVDKIRDKVSSTKEMEPNSSDKMERK